METVPIRLMKDRRYEWVPIDRIAVLNSRSRDSAQFADNVRSIQDVGLLKPVLVNRRFLEESGKYELVCGEGRLIAHQRLRKKEILAEVIDCDRKEAYLRSLIENIARVPAGTMWFAREVERMQDEGMTLSEIGKITVRSEAYVAAFLKLARQGEERLIRGVEQGVFPVTFAVQVAESEESGIQDLLMDAFDSGLVNSGNLRRVRRVIMARENRVRSNSEPKRAGGGKHASNYTVKQLRHDIAKVCREKESFVREASKKEGMLVSLFEGMKTLRADEGIARLLKEEGLSEMPELKSPCCA
ncbi:MAG: ParB N-terminal domain-containing protein [Planctomycetota bacterium]